MEKEKVSEEFLAKLAEFDRKIALADAEPMAGKVALISLIAVVVFILLLSSFDISFLC